jgi:hypothetical protein
MATIEQEMFVLPPNATINGLSLKKVGRVFTDVKRDDNNVDRISYTFGPNYNITVMEVNGKTDVKDCYRVELPNIEERERLNEKILQIISSDSACQLTRKELTTVCYAVYLVKDIIEALAEQKYENFIKNPAVKLIAERYSLEKENLIKFFDNSGVVVAITDLCETMWFWFRTSTIVCNLRINLKMVNKLLTEGK